MQKRVPNSLVQSVRQATQAIYKVLEERGYHNDYVFCGAVARDIYGDTYKPPSEVEVLFLRPTHTLSLKQLFPTFNSQNFAYTREGENLQWQAQSTNPTAIDVVLTPPYSTYDVAEKQLVEGYPLAPYPYLVLQVLWRWGQAGNLSSQQRDLAQELFAMLQFLQNHPQLLKPIFFDKILKSAATRLVDRFFTTHPIQLAEWRGLGFFSEQDAPSVLTKSNPGASLPPNHPFMQQPNGIVSSRSTIPQAGSSKRGANGRDTRQMSSASTASTRPQAATPPGRKQQPHQTNGKQTNGQSTRPPGPDRKKRRLSPYEIRYQAAQTTTSILQNLGFTCALFGSMACKLYGNRRSPNDIDMLIVPPPHLSEITQEEIKTLLVEECPPETHFVTLKSRDPTATYKVLYFIPKPRPAGADSQAPTPPEEEEAQGEDDDAVDEELAEAVGDLDIDDEGDNGGEGKKDAAAGKKPVSKEPRPSHFKSSKVDVLIPGIMNLPAITGKLVTQRGGLPCVPYPLLLAQKLQGWADHCAAEEERFKKKIPEDVADLEWCLSQGVERNWRPWEKFGPAIWSDRRMFSEEFEQLTRERVTAICLEHPQLAACWQRVYIDP